MNKSELVDAISKAGGLEKRHSEKAVDALVSTVIGEVRAGNKVALVGFGVFNPTSRGARQGRNPQTGAPVRIAASKGVRFAPGSTFKAAVNNRGPVPRVEPLPPPRPAAKSTTAKKAAKRTTKKATSKKATARRAPARKGAAKRTTKKATSRKATARRAPARKGAAKRTTKKATARRSTRRR